jgi:hypothetical protein
MPEVLARTEEPDAIDLAGGLGGGGAGDRGDPKGNAADKGAPIHHSITSTVPEPSRHPPTGPRAILASVANA